MTSLSDRMKRYEAATRFLLPPRTYTVVRVDGKTFHSFTRHCDRPFDYTLMDAMAVTATRLIDMLHGGVLAYVQSDEISVVLQDFATHSTQPWMGGVVQKQASIAASIATAAFNAAYTHPDGVTAMFDGRVYTLPSKVEVMNYLVWRQQDATRNAVNMAARSCFSDKRLHKMKTAARQELLFTEAGVNFNDYPTRAKRGVVVRKESFVGPVTYTRADTGQVVTTYDVEQTRWVPDTEIPIFTQDRPYLDALIPSME